MTSPENSAVWRRPVLWVAALVVGLVGAWWLWPTLSGHDSVHDVLIMGDGDLAAAKVPVERRLRERGLAVVEDLSPESWCDAAARLPELLDRWQPETVVVSFRANGTCTDGVGEVRRLVDGGRDLVVMVQPGAGRTEDAVRTSIAAAAVDGVSVADATALLGGEAMPQDVGCMWWDDCRPDGAITLRDGTGELTEAGGERVARVLAGVVP